VAQGGVGVAVACRAAGLSRRSFYRAPRQRDDTTIVDALQAVVAEHGRWGFWKCFRRLRLDGQSWNHKRVLRVYRQLKLNLPRRIKKRLPQRERQTLVIDALPNRLWSIDFMSDVLYGGRRFRTFNVLDEGVREALAIEIDTSLPSERVVRVFEQLRQWRGLPIAIRCDNGPEFIAQALVDWCRQHSVELRHIQPGKPNQNAYIERFNRTYRSEVLDAHMFDDLDQVREITADWLRKYNEQRPHESLGNLPPSTFRRTVESTRGSLISV
jgi:putative transposase